MTSVVQDVFVPAHLTPFTDPMFMGLSVLSKKGPLIAEYLMQALEQIHFVGSLYRRVYAVRLDLSFPKWALEDDNPYRQIWCQRSTIEKFVRSLEERIQTDCRNRFRAGKRVSPTRVHWMRAYEIGHAEQNPHYHLMLLLNGDTYGSTGSFASSGNNLMTRMHQAWASALGLDESEVVGLVNVAGQYRFRLDDWFGVEECFKAASYLCKADTKPFRGRLHPFRCAPQKMPSQGIFTRGQSTL